MNNPQTWKQIASRKEYLRNEMLKPYMVSDVDQRLPQVHSVQERSRPRLTPGGSTGGEAALLALHGTLLGFGTDIGGSTRIPQSIVDLYGLKPTISRLPYLGVPVSTEGQEHVPSSIGPMARDLASIVYVSRSVANAKPWELDPKCTLLPWNEDTFQEIQGRPIVVSLILDDGVVRTPLSKEPSTTLNISNSWISIILLTAAGISVVTLLPPESLSHNWDLYDVKAMEGHPINVQVIGKKLNEERVLGAATVIERVWRDL